MKPYTLLLLGLLLASAAEAQTTDEARLEVTVTDAASGEALGYAVCSLRPKEGNGKERAAAADARGVCLLEGLKPGRFELRLLYMGHVFLQGELQLPAGLTRRRIRLDIDPVAIGEVLVTAAESKGSTSSSKIGREAIAHIQPSSIADLMELIPGGRATDRPLVRSAAGDPPARSRPFELRQLRYVGIGYPDSGRRHPHK